MERPLEARIRSNRRPAGLADLVRFTAELERQPATGIQAEKGFRH